MKKLYARLAPSDSYIDLDGYFDFREESEQGDLTLIAPSRYKSFKTNEWGYIEEVIDNVSYYLENLVSYESPAFYKRFSDVLDDYLPGWENGKKRSARLIHEWKEAVRAWDRNGMEDETACRLLELYTGKKWDCADITGCSQGDFATIYFPRIENETKRRAYVEAISAYYFVTGAEVEIHDGENEPEDGDDVSGYWEYIAVPFPTTNEIKQYIAESEGIEPDEITLFIPAESHTVTTYNYEIA